MGRKLLITGIALVVAVMPTVTALGLAAHGLMGCEGGGSSGPVYGCRIMGYELNWIAALATPAFVASFLTVPIGLLVLGVSFVVNLFSSESDNEADPKT